MLYALGFPHNFVHLSNLGTFRLGWKRPMLPELVCPNSHSLMRWQIFSNTLASKANEWLDPLMLRRTKSSRLVRFHLRLGRFDELICLFKDGKLILEELPSKDIEIVELEFSDGERKVCIYMDTKF